MLVQYQVFYQIFLTSFKNTIAKTFYLLIFIVFFMLDNFLQALVKNVSTGGFYHDFHLN